MERASKVQEQPLKFVTDSVASGSFEKSFSVAKYDSGDQTDKLATYSFVITNSYPIYEDAELFIEIPEATGWMVPSVKSKEGEGS